MSTQLAPHTTTLYDDTDLDAIRYSLGNNEPHDCTDHFVYEDDFTIINGCHRFIDPNRKQFVSKRIADAQRRLPKWERAALIGVTAGIFIGFLLLIPGWSGLLAGGLIASFVLFIGLVVGFGSPNDRKSAELASDLTRRHQLYVNIKFADHAGRESRLAWLARSLADQTKKTASYTSGRIDKERLIDADREAWNIGYRCAALEQQRHVKANRSTLELPSSIDADTAARLQHQADVIATSLDEVEDSIVRRLATVLHYLHQLQTLDAQLESLEQLENIADHADELTDLVLDTKKYEVDDSYRDTLAAELEPAQEGISATLKVLDRTALALNSHH